MKSVSILIPNRYSWDGICLTLESIFKRTQYPRYEVIVCDNSLAPNNRACELHEVKILNDDDGNRREYLRHQAHLGNIQLIENTSHPRRYGHGENIKRLIRVCETDFAMLFISSAEIIDGDWLHCFVNHVKDKWDLGVARNIAGGIHGDSAYKPPVYWPNVMLLDMIKYRDFRDDSDWDLDHIPFSQFERKEMFNGLYLPGNPWVFCDTGWRLAERMQYNNPEKYRLYHMPTHYYMEKINIIGGLDRNSHRPQIPYMQERFVEIEQRLRVLRSQ